jgi:hypothetical protein
LDEKARFQGLYVIGKNGTGKTNLLLNLILHDLKSGQGVCVLDPHGDLVRDTIARMPGERVEDVILLDPLYYEYPFGLNLFECQDPQHPILASRTASQVVQIFKKLWGTGEGASWGPQLEDLLRNASYTLIENQGVAG